jgi:hypothetical protein
MEIVTSPEMTSPEVALPEMMSPEMTENDVTGTGNEREIISRLFYPYFPPFFSGTPLDSRYEQWSFVSNPS